MAQQTAAGCSALGSPKVTWCHQMVNIHTWLALWLGNPGPRAQHLLLAAKLASPAFLGSVWSHGLHSVAALTYLTVPVSGDSHCSAFGMARSCSLVSSPRTGRDAWDPGQTASPAKSSGCEIFFRGKLWVIGSVFFF